MSNITLFNTLTMTSREIAELTGKEHKNVLRDIDNLLTTLSSDLSFGFKSSTYTSGDPPRSYRQFELDRDSSLCLVAGYDANARMRIIKRWQELEAQQYALPQTYVAALEALLAAEKEKLVLVDENKALHAVADNEFSHCSIIRVAQYLRVPEKTFNWRTLKAMTSVLGLTIKQVPSPRYTYQNLYPLEAFIKCYPQYNFEGLQPKVVVSDALRMLRTCQTPSYMN
ncbi:Rha family transcriptional regulator [Chromatium okenii]|uniref:Rha family transcriptional regulator n=1 Tax=Chromatium okenii TaxID=61644 RepID=UPI0026EC0A09|nr:Rha family transcriptional regulator [Chromatium okenii]MBV5310891.1 Rha family transcriptional regulator [Chromatium okenii]